jgi:hypothetical protein
LQGLLTPLDHESLRAGQNGFTGHMHISLFSLVPASEGARWRSVIDCLEAIMLTRRAADGNRCKRTPRAMGGQPGQFRVMLAKAGIQQDIDKVGDSRVRGNDNMAVFDSI